MSTDLLSGFNVHLEVLDAVADLQFPLLSNWRLGVRKHERWERVRGGWALTPIRRLDRTVLFGDDIDAIGCPRDAFGAVFVHVPGIDQVGHPLTASLMALKASTREKASAAFHRGDRAAALVEQAKDLVVQLEGLLS